MKPIALATLALLASSPASPGTLGLPNEMLGTWCTTQDPAVEEKDGTTTVKYERRPDCNPAADDTSIVDVERTVWIYNPLRLPLPSTFVFKQYEPYAVQEAVKVAQPGNSERQSNLRCP
jgi:hypothetical protein